MDLVSPQGWQSGEGQDGVTCPGQRCQWQRKWVDDFDFLSYNKELEWSDLSLRLGPKQEVWCIAHLHLGLEGSPRLLAIAQGCLLQYITRVSL